MQKYELTVVFDKKTTPAKRKTSQESITKTVGLLKGKVGSTLDWGEKGPGFMLHIPLELTPDTVHKLSEKLKTEGAIIRYLLVRN
jgi:ribosomal protein S6